MIRLRHRNTKNIIALAAVVSVIPATEAGFTLNFQPAGGGTMSTSIVHGGSVINNQTPFLKEGGLELPELVTDPDTGLSYYHVIIGDIADGFIQETYIQAGYGAFPGGSGSAVGGDGDAAGGNGQDPLNRNPAINTANAEANPRKVLVRQIVSDGEIAMEFLKDDFDKKPLISQMVSAPDIITQFEIDMRNSDYGDANTPALITNTMTVFGLGAGLGAFDMATDAPNSYITGGRYTYSDGAGPGGSAGTYNYYDGGYNPMAEDWSNYFDYGETNPWAYNANKP